MSNSYDTSRGNSQDRQRRRSWLLATYRADVDVFNGLYPEYCWDDVKGVLATHRGLGNPACRCYRCGVLMILESLTVDRIIPGCKGGTYRRNNIRPSCSECATETGNEVKNAKDN